MDSQPDRRTKYRDSFLCNDDFRHPHAHSRNEAWKQKQFQRVNSHKLKDGLRGLELPYILIQILKIVIKTYI